MSRKLIHTVTNGVRVVKVYSDSESNEYIARLYVNGVLNAGADYYEDRGHTRLSWAEGMECTVATAEVMACPHCNP